MAGTRNRYSRQFKMEAVRRVLEDGQPQKRVAEELGINSNSLAAWKRAYLQDPTHSFPGNGKQKPEAAELERLRTENAALQRELEFLKKAAAYFAKSGK